jgi:hypothetical protein
VAIKKGYETVTLQVSIRGGISASRRDLAAQTGHH